MWEQPPLLSAHSFRPAERGMVGRKDGTGTRGEGSKEELNIDETTPAEQFSLGRHKERVEQKDKTPKVWVCVHSFNHPAS